VNVLEWIVYIHKIGLQWMEDIWQWTGRTANNWRRWQKAEIAEDIAYGHCYQQMTSLNRTNEPTRSQGQHKVNSVYCAMQNLVKNGRLLKFKLPRSFMH